MGKYLICCHYYNYSSRWHFYPAVFILFFHNELNPQSCISIFYQVSSTRDFEEGLAWSECYTSIWFNSQTLHCKKNHPFSLKNKINLEPYSAFFPSHWAFTFYKKDKAFTPMANNVKKKKRSIPPLPKIFFRRLYHWKNNSFKQRELSETKSQKLNFKLNPKTQKIENVIKICLQQNQGKCLKSKNHPIL